MTHLIMALTLTLLLFLVILTFNKASPVKQSTSSRQLSVFDQETNEQLVQDHLLRTIPFCCKSPQPTAVSIRDALVDKKILTIDKKFTPFYTVLNRCTGGCQLGKCEMQEAEDVQLTFLVHDSKTRKSEYMSLVAKNHTECKCITQNDINIIK